MSHAPIRLAVCACLLCATILPSAAQDATVQATGGLRLRSGASTNSSILTTMVDGTTVQVISEAENGWYQLSYGQYTGYAYGQYLNILPSPPSEEVTSSESSDATDTQGVDQEASSTLSIRVTNGPLNIRSGPDTSYDRVGSLSVGTVVETSGKSGNWYQIDGGYVYGDYVCEIDLNAQTASAVLGQQIADYALTFVGCSYSYGGNGPTSFDCSGLVKYVMSNFDIAINRTASAQLSNGTAVTMAELQPGDAVYFKASGSTTAASHTGIYIGDGRFVHAADYDSGVKISELYSSYYTKIYVGARRMT